MTLTIGEVAKATGLAAKTIRYYEQVGVLPPPGRTAAGYRQYTEPGVQQLRFIRRARALGLPLHRLKALRAALDGGPSPGMRPRLRALVRVHLSTVQRRIEELGRLQRQLEQVLRRLVAPSRERPRGGCRCLDLEESPAPSERRAPRAPRRRGHPTAGGA
jgi:DNA-binding transcriptional MerR regulator